MRVNRRARPSQVGFAASVGRRRLLQEFDAQPEPTQPDPIATDRLRMLVRLDFSSPESARFTDEDVRGQPVLATSSSARGR